MIIKKILFILHVPPPVHGASMMGRYVMESRKINETFDCSYINLTTASNIEDISNFRTGKIFSFLKLYWKVLTSVAVNRYDLCYLTINSHGAGFYKEIIIVFILKLFRCRIVFHYHNKGVTKGQSNRFLNRIYRFQFRNEKVILLSKLLYPDISIYLSENNVYYCPNGVPDLKRTGSDDVMLKNSSNSVPEILFLSNMMKEKGVIVLLDACRLLKKRNIRFSMNFVGAWANISEKDFNSYVELNDLNNVVKYSGKKYNDEKDNSFRKADVFIHPTLNDCFPLVIIEAMKFGLPVISTNEGAIPEIVKDNYNGFLVPKNDPEALAIKITELINDPYLRLEMGRCGRRRFEEHYTVENFEQNFVKALNEIAPDFAGPKG